LTLGLAELVLIRTGYDYRPLVIEANRDTRASLLFDDDHFEYDPALFWRPKPGFEIFNRQGFRGRELPAKKPEGAYWIIAVGDSNTLGWRGEDAPNWPGSLQKLLRRDSDRFEVVNAGVWGYSSYQGLIRLEEVLAYQPDMVLISFGSNDAHPVRVSDRHYGESLWSERLQRLVAPSRLGRLLTATVMKLTTFGGGEITHRVSLNEYRENLESMVHLAQAHEVQLVFLSRPYIGSMPRVIRWKSYAHLYNAVTAEVAERHGLPLIDFYHLFKNKDQLFSDESHFTEEGHQIAAGIVREHVLPWLSKSSLAGP